MDGTKRQSAAWPALLNMRQARTYLGDVSRDTVGKLRASGEIIAIRVGRKRVMFPRDGIDTYIAQRVKKAKTRGAPK